MKGFGPVRTTLQGSQHGFITRNRGNWTHYKQAVCGISCIYHIPSSVTLRTLRFVDAHAAQNCRLLLLGKIACLPHDDVQRGGVFQSASFELKLPALPRRRGRPRHTWNNEVYRLATQACGNKEKIQVWRQPSKAWRRQVKKQMLWIGRSPIH